MFIKQQYARELPERVEGQAGHGPDARAHEALVELDGVERAALQVVHADALVHRAAATHQSSNTFSLFTH